jgi:hypothetical protein
MSGSTGHFLLHDLKKNHRRIIVAVAIMTQSEMLHGFIPSECFMLHGFIVKCLTQRVQTALVDADLKLQKKVKNQHVAFKTEPVAYCLVLL